MVKPPYCAPRGGRVRSAAVWLGVVRLAEHRVDDIGLWNIPVETAVARERHHRRIGGVEPADGGLDVADAAADAAGASTVYWQTQEYNADARALYDTLARRTSHIVYQR